MSSSHTAPVEGTAAPPAARRRAAARLAALAARPGAPIVVATVVLFAISPLVVAGSLASSSLATTLPFAAILVVAAAGQTLVIQQGGLDFSVGGGITLAAVILTRVAQEDAGRLPLALAAVLAAAAAIGVVKATLVTRFGVTPLIVTLGVNALVLGVVQQVSGGVSVVPAPDGLTELALGKTLGVFNLVLVAAAIVALGAFTIKRTVVGRRFEAIGSNIAAAHAAGLPVTRYKVLTYVAASVLYALAGVMLAGFLRTPGLDIGNSYLLATIAAVVLGGTALTGGAGSVVATAVAAVFLTQLSQLLLATGATTAVIFLVQGVAIGASMAVRTGLDRWHDMRRHLRAAGAARREQRA